jgi:hypothetical protein
VVLRDAGAVEEVEMIGADQRADLSLVRVLVPSRGLSQ